MACFERNRSSKQKSSLLRRFLPVFDAFLSRICYNRFNIVDQLSKKGGCFVSYNALQIAQYIISYEAAHGRTVSNLRLQKLLYFVQAQFLANTPDGRPCFQQRMEAWDFGPVVPEVYREYRYYGSSVIPPTKSTSTNITSSDQALIDNMLDHCANYSTSTLVDITHAQAPWQDAHRNLFDDEITPDSIYRYFRGA